MSPQSQALPSSLSWLGVSVRAGGPVRGPAAPMLDLPVHGGPWVWLSSQARGAEPQCGPVWGLGVLVASLLPLLGRFGGRGVREPG